LKVEPKTFFANERTFIQWVGMAVLLFTMGIGLVGLGSANVGAMKAGVSLVVLAIIFMIYALALFLRRSKSIRMQSVGPYDDSKGPVILVSVLITVIVINMILLNIDTTLPVFPVDNGVACVKLAEHGIAEQMMPGFISPSSSLYIESKKQFVVVSASNVHFIDAVSGRVMDTHTLSNIDLEAVAYNPAHPDILILASETPYKVIQYNMNTRSVVDEYDFPTGYINNVNFEGLTYDSKRDLYWASLGDIIGFQLAANQTMLVTNVIKQEYFDDSALLLSTKVSDLYYSAEEDFMYITFDKTNQLEVLDMVTGNVIATYKLPGRNMKWEGLSFANINGETRAVMALDSPGQIWSFSFSLNSGFGSCAL
jgi:uncharacterized membrane protein YidH (DUF202 family)